MDWDLYLRLQIWDWKSDWDLVLEIGDWRFGFGIGNQDQGLGFGLQLLGTVVKAYFKGENTDCYNFDAETIMNILPRLFQRLSWSLISLNGCVPCDDDTLFQN